MGCILQHPEGLSNIETMRRMRYLCSVRVMQKNKEFYVAIPTRCLETHHRFPHIFICHITQNHAAGYYIEST